MAKFKTALKGSTFSIPMRAADNSISIRNIVLDENTSAEDVEILQKQYPDYFEPEPVALVVAEAQKPLKNGEAKTA